ncbi:MAG TPA: hypothetical protein VNR67_06270 [Solirubrobacterales bacterium]|nr:hypothetical protein [Solirubrobacterales bacterium]
MRLRAVIPLAIAIASLALGAASEAEVEQRENLRVNFDADFVPHALPRTRPAPVKVEIEGRIATTDGSHPPPLRWLEVEIHRNGVLDGQGLPVCAASTLQSTSTEVALDRCRPALVGRGEFRADVALGRGVLSSGRILAFHSRRGGRETLLLHLFAAVPVRFTLIVPLTVDRRRNEQFGTVLRARIPRIGGIVSVTQIGLTIGRRYSHAGASRSYVSAACSAPAGLDLAVFPFARGRFRFEGHREIRTTLVRDCSVRQRPS